MSTISLSPKLKVAVRREVATVLQEFFGDPDFGLELTESAKRRLARARKGGGKRFSLAEMRRRYL